MDKLIKNKNYYDSIYEENKGILKIRRIYKVDEYSFTDATYDQLARIYRELPEYIFSPSEYCSWYGDYFKKDIFYLYVKFENNGLEIIGNLPVKDFQEWESEFHSRIIKIPFK